MGRLADGPNGWIGVDFDRTLSQRGHDGGNNMPGPAVPEMVARVKRWLDQGINVRIFTARVAPLPTETGWFPPEEQHKILEAWCLEHLGQVLPITCSKDYFMKELWDDAVVAVEENTGRQLSPSKVDGPQPMPVPEQVSEQPSKGSGGQLSFGFID